MVSGPAFFVVGRRVVIFAKVWQGFAGWWDLLLIPLSPFFGSEKLTVMECFTNYGYWHCYEGGEFHGSIGGGCGTDQS